jgi:membrane-bound lytic murein transglycosylase D
LLVPGDGSASGLTSLLNAAAPQHIIEPERAARACGKSAKRGAKPCVVRENTAAAKSSATSKRITAGGDKPGAKTVAKSIDKAQPRTGQQILSRKPGTATGKQTSKTAPKKRN